MKSHVYPSAEDVSRHLIRYFIGMMEKEPERIFHFAFSGGTTPSLMFQLWANEYKDLTPWDRMRIYWVDERCVGFDSPDSNYGTMRRLLLNVVGMPEEYVFPIHAFRPPREEAARYSAQVAGTLPSVHGFPTFDVVILGAGEDGHTSSIFPGQERLLSSSVPYEASVNPYNGQQRIAMTGYLIFKARKVIFLITGENKAAVVRDILRSGDAGPAAYVAHHASDVEIFTDVQAAGTEGESI